MRAPVGWQRRLPGWSPTLLWRSPVSPRRKTERLPIPCPTLAHALNHSLLWRHDRDTVCASGAASVAGPPLLADNGVEIRRRIAIMPESPGLYLRLSVAENLACFAGLYELADTRRRIEEALRAVNLVERRNDPCGSLSKGL